MVDSTATSISQLKRAENYLRNNKQVFVLPVAVQRVLVANHMRTENNTARSVKNLVVGSQPEGYPIIFKLKGRTHQFATPEAIIRGGASTMVEQTTNSADKLCEFMGQAHSVDILQADNTHYTASIREHAGYLAELASFATVPFTYFERMVLAGLHKPGTMPENYRKFLEQYGFILLQTDQQDKEWGKVDSRDYPLIDRYFRLWTLDDTKSILDINLEKITAEEMTRMLSTGLYTKCHARGEVMKEMVQWLLDIYTKWVLPMFQYESRAK